MADDLVGVTLHTLVDWKHQAAAVGDAEFLAEICEAIELRIVAIGAQQEPGE